MEWVWCGDYGRVRRWLQADRYFFFNRMCASTEFCLDTRYSYS
jgi:hypothetical protein